MKTSHTPGPWSARALDAVTLFPYIVIGQDGHAPVARCIPTGTVALGQVTNEQAKSNARLIAAAPELLEIAQEFCRRVELGEIKSKETYRQFKAAIAKATQKSS